MLRSLMLGCRRLLPEAAAGVILLALSSLSADELPLYRDPSKTTATGRATDVVTLAQGIRTKLPETEVEVVGGCGLLETPGALTDAKEVADETAMTDPSSTIDDAVRAASAADVCILALGEPRAWSGENASRAHLGLTGRQQHLLEAVAKTGKPIVVVLFCGRPLQLRALLDKADSLLVAWHPGIQAGNAIADLLFGDSAPAGGSRCPSPSMWGSFLSITIDIGPGNRR